MILSAPFWLWFGFLALIPLLIHLWNKRSAQPRLLGTFRFLPEESFAAAKRIELHEIPLMLIRMALVTLLTVLLAGLFFEDEIKKVEYVIISEISNGEMTSVKLEEETHSVLVSSKEIEQKGWWNIIEQVEYLQQPDRIRVRGDFSEVNFKGARPTSNTMITWEASDSLYTDEQILTAWQFGNDRYQALIQRRTEAGIQTIVEEVNYSEIQNNEVKVLEEPKFIISSENDELVNLGLKFTADSWKIEVEEQPLTELAQLQLGEKIFHLNQAKEESGSEGIVESNSTFGLPISVKGLKTDIDSMKEIMITQDEHIPFIYIDSDSSFVVNGSVDDELQSWVYAGIANRFLVEVIGIDELLTPTLIDAQRNPAVGMSSVNTPIPKEKRSARLWLLSLLVLCWLTERWLAPSRGM